jgi:hypothetical protein
MIAKLWQYFGIIGFGSMACWAVAFVVFACYPRSKQRTRYYWIAAVLALLGLVLANVNSHFVSAIEVDRSEELAKGIERQKQLRAELEADAKSKAAKVRFAEDSATDALDLAGLPTTTNVYELAAQQDDDAKYAYRKRGKQQRNVSTDAQTNVAIVGSVAPEVKANVARTMLEADVVNANRCDRINLFLARFCLWLAAILVIWDYLARFNRTLGHLYPLPIAHEYLDSIWPKTHTVLFRHPAPDAVRRYLENTVRRGETFLYLGLDPCLACDSLPRFRWRQWQFWQLPKLTVTNQLDDEFAFEAAWFHRYCVVVPDAARARALLNSLLALLDQRRATRARARKTVHIVWAFPDAPSREARARLNAICPDTNFKFLLTAQADGEHFEEVCELSAVTSHPEGARLPLPSGS